MPYVVALIQLQAVTQFLVLIVNSYFTFSYQFFHFLNIYVVSNSNCKETSKGDFCECEWGADSVVRLRGNISSTLIGLACVGSSREKATSAAKMTSLAMPINDRIF